MGFLLHSSPSQFAGFMKSSLANHFFYSQMCPSLLENMYLSCSGKVINVLNYNQELQFLEMSQHWRYKKKMFDDVQTVPGVIVSFVTNRNTNETIGKARGHHWKWTILAACLTIQPGDLSGPLLPLLWSSPNKWGGGSGLALDVFKMSGICLPCGNSKDACWAWKVPARLHALSSRAAKALLL